MQGNPEYADNLTNIMNNVYKTQDQLEMLNIHKMENDGAVYSDETKQLWRENVKI